MARTTEAEIAVVVLRILETYPNGAASMAQLKQEIPNYINLSAEDRVQSTTRPNEEMWEQQVRNITSHYQSPGNIIHDGYADRIEGGLQITAAGKLHLRSLGY